MFSQFLQSQQQEQDFTMNYHFKNTTAASMPPVVTDAIVVDIESSALPLVPVAAAPKTPHQKPSIPRDPKVSKTDNLSSAPAPARPNYLRNHIILFFVVYVVLQYPFSYSVFRKVWRLTANIGSGSANQHTSAASNTINARSSEYEQFARDQVLQCQLNATMDAAKEKASLDVVHSNNMKKVNATEQAQNRCHTSHSSVRMTLHQNVKDNKDLPFLQNEGTCPPDTQAMIRTMAGVDAQDERLSVFESIAEGYNMSQQSYDTLVDYSQERAGYDYDYIVRIPLATLDIVWPTIPPFFHKLYDWIVWIFGEYIYFLIEMVCQVWFTVNRYRYYWNQSSIPITEVNVGVSRERSRKEEPERIGDKEEAIA